MALFRFTSGPSLSAVLVFDTGAAPMTSLLDILGDFTTCLIMTCISTFQALLICTIWWHRRGLTLISLCHEIYVTHGRRYHVINLILENFPLWWNSRRSYNHHERGFPDSNLLHMWPAWQLVSDWLLMGDRCRQTRTGHDFYNTLFSIYMIQYTNLHIASYTIESHQWLQWPLVTLGDP